MTGKPTRTPTSTNKEANKLKNKNGRLFLNNLTIVIITLKPSEKVFSFDSLPSGRSR